MVMKSEDDGNPDSSGEGGARGALARRLAVAGVLVAFLLGVLAVFDYLANAPDEADEATFSKPVPVAPKREVSQPVTPAEPPTPIEMPKDAAPVEAPPPPPVVEAVPAPPVKTDNEAPPVPHAASGHANRPHPRLGHSAGVPEATMAPSNLPPRLEAPVETPSAKPVSRAVEARQQASQGPVPVTPAAPHLLSGFVLQAGVFTSIQRAEELHARLTLNGVSSTVEARVQIGPFKTRQEAEAAQLKLKELGINTLLVPPKGKN